MAMPRLTSDFRAFLSVLNSEKVEYLVIGGYAVGYYGYVRYTKDIDIWIAVAPANLERLRQSLQRFGFAAESLPSPLFEPPRTVLRFGRPPTRIEILSSIAGVRFDDCYPRRATTRIEGIDIPVIALEDLVKNKTASGRPQDIADVAKITRARGGS